ncbi:EthD family reductase [Erwinia persicina]|uniref:EthD family reductase n=1 Tax=Erwinia persicina TaxID=55211 RepID=UPI00177C070E|nr:EthD family reductase [Erwinia persicina]MBD8213305.1 EthD family reductase [Erwinia persicina]
MIKFSVLYPRQPGAHFDHDYYRDVHLPLIQSRMGAACQQYEIDTPLDSNMPYIAACHIYCPDRATFDKVIAEHGAEFAADVANFTNVESQKLVSEVLRVN